MFLIGNKKNNNIFPVRQNTALPLVVWIGLGADNLHSAGHSKKHNWVQRSPEEPDGLGESEAAGDAGRRQKSVRRKILQRSNLDRILGPFVQAPLASLRGKRSFQ